MDHSLFTVKKDNIENTLLAIVKQEGSLMKTLILPCVFSPTC